MLKGNSLLNTLMDAVAGMGMAATYSTAVKSNPRNWNPSRAFTGNYPESSDKQNSKRWANLYNHRTGFTTVAKVGKNVLRDSRWV
jgi:hypothetical protein